MRTEIISKSYIWKSFENKSGETLYITGHSKGGALATGATVDFEKKFKGKIVTYTFEAARFFTANGINNKDDESDINNKPLLDKIWRFEYLYDVVPHVPLGKITQDYLLKYKKDHEFIVELLERGFSLPKDWIENNNITFVPAGKLKYVGIVDGKLEDQQQPDISDQDHYRKRFIASLEKMKNNLFHLKDFVIKQHSNCYLYYLEAKTTNASLNPEDQPRCF